MSAKSRAKKKEYYAERDRWSRIKRIYGLTKEQYSELFNNQNGCCLVCLKHQREFVRRLHVDHDHKTGEVFGLLCNFCNHRFIGRNRNPEHYERAAEYLRKGTGWFVPEKKKKTRRKKSAKRT
jgi:hypothetical protein